MKLAAKWVGSVTVVECKRQYSHTVEIEDGPRRSVHANNLRPHFSHAGAVSVIFEDDEEFGDVQTLPRRNQESANRRTVNLDHSNSQQRQEVVEFIGTYSEVFAGKPRTCKPGT